MRTCHNRPKAYPTIFNDLYTTLTGDCLSQTYLFDMATEVP
ncbi:hypothetical protein UW601_01645 [Streptococcus agalactiae]